jgi:hypothetical protein
MKGWDLFVLDISTASLQGMTYEEMTALTGSEPRNVAFQLPASTVPVFRKLKGCEHFNSDIHVLWARKAMYGLKDAPRAW